MAQTLKVSESSRIEGQQRTRSQSRANASARSTARLRAKRRVSTRRLPLRLACSLCGESATLKAKRADALVQRALYGSSRQQSGITHRWISQASGLGRLRLDVLVLARRLAGRLRPRHLLHESEAGQSIEDGPEASGRPKSCRSRPRARPWSRRRCRACACRRPRCGRCQTCPRAARYCSRQRRCGSVCTHGRWRS